jgi:Tol biopolymer transport system component
MRPDGTDQRRLTFNECDDCSPVWSPDARRIAFATREKKQIYAMNADGSQEQQLTDRGLSEDPSWSPDGSAIVFQSSRDGNFEIYTLSVADAFQGSAGSACQRLTNHAAGDFWPSWGPAPLPRADAAPIVFERSTQTFASVPTWQIALADLDADGDLDAVFANSQREASQVWLNDSGAQDETPARFSDSGQ